MLNLIKYEIRGDYKKILAVVITIAIIDIALLLKLGTWKNALVFGLSLAVAVGAGVIMMILNVKLLSKYLYSDSGYLFFTLPQSGSSILCSRFIVSLIENFIVGFAVCIFSYIVTKSTVPGNELIFKQMNAGDIIKVMIFSIWICIDFLMYVYFSIIIGKVTLRNRKFGKFGALLTFGILITVVARIGGKLEKVFPQKLVIGASTSFNFFPTGISCNIALLVVDVSMFIILFVAASYLIDNKLDM